MKWPTCVCNFNMNYSYILSSYKYCILFVYILANVDVPKEESVPIVNKDTAVTEPANQPYIQVCYMPGDRLSTRK